MTMDGCGFCALAESYLASPPLANAPEEEIRYANVAKVMGDHREQIDDLLRRLVQRNLGGRQA
jgi:hypothetical protein